MILLVCFENIGESVMAASRKSLAYSVVLLISLCLIACQKADQQAPAPVENKASATAAVEPAPQVAAPPAESNIYSGTFLPTEDYIRAKAEFNQWTETEEGGASMESRDINDFPQQFRKYLFQDPLYGSYNFVTPNRLTVIIHELNDDGSFQGQSVAAGNQRAINGTWQKTDEGIRLTGEEPSDDKNDGTFEMLLNGNTISGSWTPFNNPKGSKEFTLLRKDFSYIDNNGQQQDQEGYVDLGSSGFEKNPSIDELKTEDVENLTQPQIRIIRNLVFARHGYSFNNKDLRLVFESYPWYVPVSNDVKAELTDIEKSNLALLVRYEKYADKHYDEFGR
jgi:hypothetical protein